MQGGGIEACVCTSVVVVYPGIWFHGFMVISHHTGRCWLRSSQVAVNTREKTQSICKAPDVRHRMGGRAHPRQLQEEDGYVAKSQSKRQMAVGRQGGRGALGANPHAHHKESLGCIIATAATPSRMPYLDESHRPLVEVSQLKENLTNGIGSNGIQSKPSRND